MVFTIFLTSNLDKYMVNTICYLYFFTTFKKYVEKNIFYICFIQYRNNMAGKICYTYISSIFGKNMVI